jgi:H+-translocating NAD(P) transhydrogenase subunit beta
MIDILTGLGFFLATALTILGLFAIANPLSARRGLNSVITAVTIGVVSASIGLGLNGLTLFLAAVILGGGAAVAVTQKFDDATSVQRWLLTWSGALLSMAIACVGIVVAIDPQRVAFPTGWTAAIGAVLACMACSGFVANAMDMSPRLSGSLERLRIHSGKPLTGPLLVVGILAVTSGLLQYPVLLIGSLLVMFGLAVVGSQQAARVDHAGLAALSTATSGSALAFAGTAIANPYLASVGAMVAGAGAQLVKASLVRENLTLRTWLSGLFVRTERAGHSTASAINKVIRGDDLAILLAFARKVIVVPGYGLAAANAQDLLRDLIALLDRRRVDVRVATHPVGGRMPGHLTQILLVAGVPSAKFCTIEEINPQFPGTDVALVIGANDIVNPGAREDRANPLFGMPVLDVDKARDCIVIKRGAGKGFSGVENNLFSIANCRVWHADAGTALSELITAVGQLG